MMNRNSRRGPWLPEEDQTLLQLVRSQGPNNWVRISSHMQHRSPKQCRERYHQNLKPSLNHEPISAQEGEMIEQMVREMGRHWAEIARRLGNRSDNAVKNWWNGSMNRKKRHGNQVGTGTKTQVGHRSQPIPATRSSRNTFAANGRNISDHQLVHQRPHAWTQASPQPRSLGQPIQQYPNYHNPVNQYPIYDPRILDTSRNTHITASTAYTPTPEPFNNPTSNYQHPQTQYQTSSPHPTNNHSSSNSWQASRARPETSLISPVASEMSRAPSLRQAPSLVSDHQSTYSVSPKTVPSPKPSTLAPIDTTSREWAAQSSMRRSSVPVIPHLHATSAHPHSDEGYVSAILPSTVSSAEPKYYAPTLERDVQASHSQDRYPLPPHALSIPAINPRQRDLLSPSDLSPNSARDARMHVASILG